MYMKDILIGIVIVLVAFFIIDFIYTEKNTCVISSGYQNKEEKCGVLKKELNIDIYLFDRYW